jgi:hypothetical protein
MIGEHEVAYFHRDGRRWAHRGCFGRSVAEAPRREETRPRFAEAPPGYGPDELDRPDLERWS